MLAAVPAAAAPPLAPPGADDAPTLDLYVGDERRTAITTNFGTATERVDLTKMMASLDFFAGHASPKKPQVICLEESRAVRMRL